MVGTLLSCTDNFEDLNTDKKNPSSVTGESLFNSATEEFYEILNNSSVNTNVFRLYSQYWAQTTYPEESQYAMTTRSIPDNWYARIYRDVLIDLEEAKKIIAAVPTNSLTAPVQQNKLAIIEVMEVHAWATLVDIFGNVPYTQALDFSNPSAQYDDAKTIYMDIIDRLDAAIGQLDASYDEFASDEDLINQGDTGMWVKAANSLKLRLALRIADVDAAKSKSMAESAVAAGVFSTLDENQSIEYVSTQPYTNPVYSDLVLSGRNDYVPANTIVDWMSENNDPRMPFYFRQNLGDGTYVGGVYGTNNTFALCSQLGDALYTSTTPGVVISCAEVEFLKAEAAARGYNVGGTVEEFYASGVTASILEWGGTADDAAAYLAQESVAYETAEGDWKQKVATQKWAALYNNGLEGWATWRLYDYPMLNVPEGLTYDDIPRRLTYPTNEQTRNNESLKAAISAMGGDTPQIHVFWDVN